MTIVPVKWQCLGSVRLQFSPANRLITLVQQHKWHHFFPFNSNRFFLSSFCMPCRTEWYRRRFMIITQCMASGRERVREQESERAKDWKRGKNDGKKRVSIQTTKKFERKMKTEKSLYVQCWILSKQEKKKHTHRTGTQRCRQNKNLLNLTLERFRWAM